MITGTFFRLTTIAGAVISIALGALYWSASKKLDDLQKQVIHLSTQKQLLAANNATLKSNLDKVIEANRQNDETLKKLQRERKISQEAIDALIKSREVERSKAEEANKKIDEMLKNPENNGTVAPVLRETLRDIMRNSK
jgi:chromosome segregation ATPase